jgi:transcriptional regulator with XRE-family HTH domain
MVIADRLSILVNEKAKGNRKAFAENAGLKQATFNNYISKGRPPTADALNNICNTYKVNLNWLVSGIGPRYITDQQEQQILDPDPEIASLMEGARRVLTSGNPVAFDALERNIRYFDHAIAAEKRADASEKKLQEMEDDMAIIKKEIARMKKEDCEDGTRRQGDQSQDEKAA